LSNQPGGGAIKQNAWPVCTSPAECVQPTIQAKLGSRLAEITQPAMLADFGGMVPTSLTVAVVEEAAELIDLELPGDAVDHTSWYIGEVLREGAQEAGRTELDGEAQAVVVAAMRAYQTPIAVIQVEVTGQLLRRRFSGEATVLVLLLFGQETDGHGPPPISGGGISQNLQLLREDRKCHNCAEFAFAKVCRKS
jgi:hypothetical protein